MPCTSVRPSLKERTHLTNAHCPGFARYTYPQEQMSYPLSTTGYLAIIGLILAAYGAILSTINSTIQLIEHRRDRADVLIKVRRNMSEVGGGGYGNRKVTIITAINQGKRPVTITGFASRLLDSRDAYMLNDIRPPIPYEITEGHFVSAYIFSDEENLGIVESYYAWDSVGREFEKKMVPWYRVLISKFRRRYLQVERIAKKSRV